MARREPHDKSSEQTDDLKGGALAQEVKDKLEIGLDPKAAYRPNNLPEFQRRELAETGQVEVETRNDDIVTPRKRRRVKTRAVTPQRRAERRRTPSDTSGRR